MQAMQQRSNHFLKAFLTVLVTILALLPAELWTICYFVLNPTGFWQKFAMVGGGLAVFGVVQLVCLFIGTVIIFGAIWD